MAGHSAVKTLGKKRVYFLARTDSWGWDMRDGATQAAKENGGEMVGYDEVSLGTSDFTTVLQKVRAAKPDVFIASQFGGDAIALLKQVHQMGLNKEMTIFNAFITNVVAKGVPAEALDGVYAMHYFYYDLANFPDKAVAKSAQEFTELYQAKYGAPPDGDVPRLRSCEIVRRGQDLGRADGERRKIRHREGARAMAAGSCGRLHERRLPGEGQGAGPQERMGPLLCHGRFGRRTGHAGFEVARVLERDAIRITISGACRAPERR
jgi:hypothetical protein